MQLTDEDRKMRQCQGCGAISKNEEAHELHLDSSVSCSKAMRAYSRQCLVECQFESRRVGRDLERAYKTIIELREQLKAKEGK